MTARTSSTTTDTINQATKDYQRILDGLEGEIASKEDAYQQLLKTEQNVLTILNRIVDKHQTAKLERPLFLNMSLVQMIEYFSSTWRLIVHELITLKPKSYAAYPMLLFQGDRQIVMGATLVGIAALLFFLEISS